MQKTCFSHLPNPSQGPASQDSDTLDSCRRYRSRCFRFPVPILSLASTRTFSKSSGSVSWQTAASLWACNWTNHPVTWSTPFSNPLRSLNIMKTLFLYIIFHSASVFNRFFQAIQRSVQCFEDIVKFVVTARSVQPLFNHCLPFCSMNLTLYYWLSPGWNSNFHSIEGFQDFKNSRRALKENLRKIEGTTRSRFPMHGAGNANQLQNHNPPKISRWSAQHPPTLNSIFAEEIWKAFRVFQHQGLTAAEEHRREGRFVQWKDPRTTEANNLKNFKFKKFKFLEFNSLLWYPQLSHQFE